MKCSDAAFVSEADAAFEATFRAAGGDGLRLPRVPAHGDFTPANLLVDGQGKLGVIDWDRYGDITIPFFDLLTFVERITPKGANMYLEGKPAIERHAAALGINLNAVPLLIFFSILLSDWRKRERMFPWEPAQWDRDTLGLMRTMLAQALVAFPW